MELRFLAWYLFDKVCMLMKRWKISRVANRMLTFCLIIFQWLLSLFNPKRNCEREICQRLFFSFTTCFFSSRITVHGTNFELLEKLWRGKQHQKELHGAENEMHLILSSLVLPGPFPSVLHAKRFLNLEWNQNVDMYRAKAGTEKSTTPAIGD